MMFAKLCILRICALGTRCFRRRLLVSSDGRRNEDGEGSAMNVTQETMIDEMSGKGLNGSKRGPSAFGESQLSPRAIMNQMNEVQNHRWRGRIRRKRSGDSLQCSAPCLPWSARPVIGAGGLTDGNHPPTHGRKG